MTTDLLSTSNVFDMVGSFGNFSFHPSGAQRVLFFHGSRSSREMNIQNASCEMGGREITRGPRKHINFFNINFLARTQSTPSGAQKKKKLCASFPGKGRKKETHINFFGAILGVKKGVPNGPFSATKSLVYCFFPVLNYKVRKLEKAVAVSGVFSGLLHENSGESRENSWKKFPNLGSTLPRPCPHLPCAFVFVSLSTVPAVSSFLTRRQSVFFFLQQHQWSRSYSVINQHVSLPWSFMTHGYLDLLVS